MQSRWTKPLRLYWRAQGRTRRFEGPILRMRNARQSEAKYHPAHVFMHEVDVCGHGGHALRRYLGVPGGEYRLFVVPLCEYAMRVSPGSHSALLVSSYTKRAYAVMMDISTVRISKPPGVSIAYSRPYFGNTQCEAVCLCIPLGSVLQAPVRNQHVRRWCLIREPLARRVVFADSRANFCEYAIQDALPPHPTRLSSPSTNEGQISGDVT